MVLKVPSCSSTWASELRRVFFMLRNSRWPAGLRYSVRMNPATVTAAARISAGRASERVLTPAAHITSSSESVVIRW